MQCSKQPLRPRVRAPYLIRNLRLERDLDIAAQPVRREHEVDGAAKLVRDEIVNKAGGVRRMAWTICGRPACLRLQPSHPSLTSASSQQTASKVRQVALPLA
jgi:hypothetical protein